MAIFKVGQRVRIVNGAEDGPGPIVVGREATVTSRLMRCWFDAYGWLDAYDICIDGIGSKNPQSGEVYAAPPSDLVPLTDPRAEEFCADMERFAHVAKFKVPA